MSRRLNKTGLNQDGIDEIYHRRVVGIMLAVFLLGGGETIFGLFESSRFLIRDGLEWIYDVLIYAIAAISFGRGPRGEAGGALAVAAVLAVAGVETVAQIIWTFMEPPQVEPFSITLSGLLTIGEAWAVAAALWRFRLSRNPVIESTWLSARNDVLSSTLYALVTMAARFAPMAWPQMGVDAFSAFLCFQAAWVIAWDARKRLLDGLAARDPG